MKWREWRAFHTLGGFLRNNDVARTLLAYFCNNIGSRAKFLRHCDFVGATGALNVCLTAKDMHSGSRV